MAAECHVDNSEKEPQITEYRNKFPEIEEEVLTKILREHKGEPVLCLKMLEAESKRQLYGSSPTPNDVKLKTSPSEPTIAGGIGTYMRSNSAGSGGSGSSGRSTPVNQKPTPFVVMTKPNQPTMLTPNPNHTLPSGMVITNNGCYYPTSIPQTSPNTGYATSTSGYFPSSSGNTTTTTTNDRHQPPYPYAGYGMVNTDGRQMYQTSPETYGYVNPISGAGVMTSNLPTSTNFVPINPMADGHGSPAGSARVIGNPSPYTVGSTHPPFDHQFSSYTPGTGLGVELPTYQGTQFIPTSSGLVPVNPTGTVRRQSLEKPNSSSETGEDGQYIKACLSQQRKRLEKVRKEFDIEVERSQCLDAEVNYRGQELYVRSVVAPDPTAMDVLRLAEEVVGLNRVVHEISKNIDRLENSQGFLPATNPDDNPYPTQRIVAQKTPRDTSKYDRSKSVPSPNIGDRKPPLARPLSEHNLPAPNEFHLSSLSDQELEGWSMINPGIKQEPVHNEITDRVNSDEAPQWSCTKCTFLNHFVLNTCEMCGAER